jgi:hypothetical protein
MTAWQDLLQIPSWQIKKQFFCLRLIIRVRNGDSAVRVCAEERVLVHEKLMSVCAAVVSSGLSLSGEWVWSQ